MSTELRDALTSGLVATLGGLLARPALRKFRERVSPTPAAPLLGLNGIVVKCHGGASDRDFAMGIRLAADLARSDFSTEIERNMRRLPDALAEPAPAPADAPASNGGAPLGAGE
jgi:glycerol-3-phosphate acyltransferase PlsX